MRSFVATREAMKSEKQRELDAKPHGPMAELVAKVQYMNQLARAKARIEGGG